jgi:hypothetical protein
LTNVWCHKQLQLPSLCSLLILLIERRWWRQPAAAAAAAAAAPAIALWLISTDQFRLFEVRYSSQPTGASRISIHLQLTLLLLPPTATTLHAQRTYLAAHDTPKAQKLTRFDARTRSTWHHCHATD